MTLSIDEQWMLTYLKTHINGWDDMRHEALRTVTRVASHIDFIDWTNCFLPTNRRVELNRALQAYKLARKTVLQPVRKTPRVQVALDERAARLLHNKAKEAQCSISELVIRRLA